MPQASYYLKSLKGKNTFSQAYSSGKKFYRDDAFAVFCYNNEKTINYYIGISVGKKASKKAVIRNRIKRLIRESIRVIMKELKEDAIEFAADKIIIGWRTAPKRPGMITLDDVLPEIRDLFADAHRYCIKKKKKAASEISLDRHN